MSWNPFRPFSAWLRLYRRPLAMGLGLLLLVQLITAGLPLILMEVVDTALEAVAGNDAANEEVLSEVALFAVAIAVLAALGWAVNFGMRWYFSSVSRYVERDIRAAYVGKLLQLPLSFFEERRAGDLMARATNDVEAIQRFFHHVFRMTLTGILSFVLSLALMCSIDWQLALWALAPMPLMAFSTRWIASRVHSGFRRIQEQFAAMSARIQESLAGVRVVRSYAAAHREVDDFSTLNEEYVEYNRRLVRIRALFFPFAFLLNGVSMVLILWLGGLRVIDGSLTLGAFVAFNAYLIRLGRPMMLLGRMVDEFHRAVASLERISAVLDTVPQALGGAEGTGAAPRGEIEFRDVGFSYGGREVLRGIDLRVPAGSTLAVVGRVGSGKSTLARLIPRLIESQQGEILIDGVPVAELPLRALRAAIGYVPQETFLFSDTIRENIALDVAADGERVERACDAAALAKDLAEFPHGIETVVGERGVTLSGGQRQRTALARAVVRDPRILILDDALASVDTRTEEEILHHLRAVMADRTTIIITHRLSVVRDADRILVLDDGGIAELGTHEELIGREGFYATTYRRQHLAEELTAL